MKLLTHKSLLKQPSDLPSQMGGWPIFVEGAGFFSELLKLQVNL